MAEEYAPNVRAIIPMLWVHDLQASLRFYVDGLGFTIDKRWVHEGQLRWCQLSLGGAELMLQAFWNEGAHHNVPQGALGVGVSLNLICVDALAIYVETSERGLAPEQPFVGNAMWVVGLTDPDGYKLFFESPTDVAEETVWAPGVG